LVFANEAMGTILGYSIEELKSLSPQDVAGLIHDEDKAVFFSRLEKRIHSEPANSSLEFRAVRKDGSIVWLEVFANHIEYMDKSAVQGMFLDITERKQAQATLSESEERYRDLANSLPDIVFETDANGRIIFANDRAFEIAGYTREDIEKGLNILQFIIPEERETATRNIQKFFAQGSHLPTEYTFMRKDKTTFPTLVTVNPHICGNNIIRLRGLAIDITERKKAEDALRISEKNFKAYLESSPVSVFVTNQEGKYEYINEAAIKLLGFSRDELLNMTVQQVVPEEDIPRRRFNQLKEKGYFAEEMKLEQKNSKSIDVFLSASKLPDGKLVAFCEDISERKKAEEALKQLNEVLERVGECVGAGLAVIGKDYRVVWANKLLRDLGVTSNKKCYETFNNLESVCPDCGVRKIFEQNSPIDIHEFRTVNSKGQTTWVELRVTPLKDKNGATMAALELAVPITERKKVEQELKENHDRIESMNEKLRVVGSLTRHDVGNKLMAAKSNLYLLKKRIGGNSEVAMYFDGIETAFASAERIFEFSSLYEKIGSERPSKENIFECFNQAVALLPNLGTIKIVNECQGLEVVADSLLRQIFYNFIDNSLKHGEKVNQIKISCSKEGGQVKLYYEDDGVGVSEANKIRLFEVGFTTGKGTGLGLYLVKKMMDVYGWQIQENGEPGKGIKLVMSIPEYSTNGMNNYFFRN
jgi:PAS domain S-box-containing protein